MGVTDCRTFKREVDLQLSGIVSNNEGEKRCFAEVQPPMRC